MSSSVSSLVRRLRQRAPVSDQDFDTLLPDRARELSPQFWTSVRVTLKAVDWLHEHGARRVVDVGSGVGKFCVIGALVSDMRFTGLEHRPHLVATACDLAARFAVSDRVKFVASEFAASALPAHDALYFYNPFAEEPLEPACHYDRTVDMNASRWTRDIAEAQRALERMPVGGLAITYNGFGGRVPDTFELVVAQYAGVDQLRLYRKTRTEGKGGAWLELNGPTVLTGKTVSQVLLTVLPLSRDRNE